MLKPYSSSLKNFLFPRKVRPPTEPLHLSPDEVEEQSPVIVGVDLDHDFHMLLAAKTCFEWMAKACSGAGDQSLFRNLVQKLVVKSCLGAVGQSLFRSL